MRLVQGTLTSPESARRCYRFGRLPTGSLEVVGNYLHVQNGSWYGYVLRKRCSGCDVRCLRSFEDWYKWHKSITWTWSLIESGGAGNRSESWRSINQLDQHYLVLLWFPPWCVYDLFTFYLLFNLSQSHFSALSGKCRRRDTDYHFAYLTI